MCIFCTTAEPPKRTTFVATPPARTWARRTHRQIRKRWSRRGSRASPPHLPQVGKLNVLKRLGEVDESRAAEKPTEVAKPLPLPY